MRTIAAARSRYCLAPILREVGELTDCASAFPYRDPPYEPDAAEVLQALNTATGLGDEIQLRMTVGEERG